MKNLLKERLKRGEQTLGVWIGVPSPDITEVLSLRGFDWFVFDNEHSPLDEQITQTLMMAVKGNVTPIVRVAWNDHVRVKKALDIGAHGVVVPWVNNREQAIDAVKACKYPPEGIRGCGPRRASYLDPGGGAEYLATANKEVLVCVQIETEEAVKNIHDILSVDGIDAYFIGPSDLSASTGLLGRASDPRVQKAIDDVLKAGKKHDVASGIYAFGLEDLKKRIKQGFQFIAVGSDLTLLQWGVDTLFKEIGRKG